MGDARLMVDVGTAPFVAEKVENDEQLGQYDRPLGQFGTACHFVFFDGVQGPCFRTPLTPSPEWDAMAGVSLWVKGDGSREGAAIQLIDSADEKRRWEVWFQIDSTEWKQVVLPWCDFLPRSPQTPFLGSEYAPSKLGAIGFGKGLWRRTAPPYSMTVEQVMLEPEIPVDQTDYTPAEGGAPRVLAKLRAKEPVTIVTIGDSLTDPRHWANSHTIWTNLLGTTLREMYETDVQIVNAAVGGHQLTHGLALTSLWLPGRPEPDLITVLFGANDYWNGMTPEHFRHVYHFGIDRLRRLTKGKSELLLMNCLPIRDEWNALDAQAEAVRLTAQDKRTGFCDTYGTFKEFGGDERTRPWPYAWDGHLGMLGHPLVAWAVIDAIGRGARA